MWLILRNVLWKKVKTMSNGMFQAISKLSQADMDFYNIPHKGKIVKGWLVEDYLAGPLVEADEEGFIPEWWCRIDQNTITKIK